MIAQKDNKLLYYVKDTLIKTRNKRELLRDSRPDLREQCA